MKKNTSKFASMRVLMPKHIYNLIKIYAIKNDTTISNIVRNLVEEVIDREPFPFN